MMHPSEYAQWYYLIYLLPGGVALLLLLLSALGGGMHHAHHGGQGHQGQGHQGQRHQGQGHQGHHAPTAQGTQTHELKLSLATFLGLGRVPTPLVWGSGLLGWGLFGFWGTQFWEQHGHQAAAFALPTFALPALATALAGAVLTEKATVETASRLLPREASSATATVGLCGLTGTIVFAADDARGRIHIYDAHGTLHDVSARAAPGQGRIARGCRALVMDYDAARDQVIVEEAP